jgi:hypothetical protein
MGKSSKGIEEIPKAQKLDQNYLGEQQCFLLSLFTG